MIDYFGEKSSQVEPGVLKAFGISITSRYHRADEIVQMIRFAELAASKKVAHYVKSAFYDSKGSMCTLELDPSVVDGDPVASEILDAARESIAQLLWFNDTVYHSYAGEKFEQGILS